MKCDFMLLQGKVGHFAHGKNYVLAILSFVHSTEGDEAMSPSFAAKNVAIDASNSLLEGLIAPLYMQRGCKREQFNPWQTE